MKRTIIDILKNAVNEFADSPYLGEKTDQGWQTISVKQADECSDIFAAGLLKKGFKTDDKISILSEGRTKWVVGEFGIVKARCVAVPLSIKLTPEELLFRINHSESKAILVSHNNLEKIVPVIHEIKQKHFKLIYLDNDMGFVKTIEDKYENFDAGVHLLTYDQIVEDVKPEIDKYKPKLQLLYDEIAENDVVNISYTSGTTGNPKGIMLTHLNYYANSTASRKLFDVPPNSRLFIILPLDHSFAHTAGSFVGLQVPMCLYFLDTRGGGVAALKNIPINIKEVKPNLMLTVPALSGKFMKNIIDAIDKKGGFAKWLFNKGLNAGIELNGNGFNKNSNPLKTPIYKLADKLVFSKIRETFGGELLFCVGGGALLDIKQQEFFYSIGMPIFQGYGLTEATPVISANHSGKHKLGTSGNILSNIELKIMNEKKEVPKGQKGEIFIRADSVMKGYYKNPEATAEVLREGGLFSGDLGYIDEDGFLMVTGREKALLISEDGEKYSPEEIEEGIANTSSFVEQIMLYNDHSKYTTAIVTLDSTFVKKYVAKNGIKNPEDLYKAINISIQNIVNVPQYAGKFQNKWIPSLFRIAPEQFTEENKMINSTMKMVRYKITENYRNLIDEMYEPNAKSNNEHNLKLLELMINK
ncbi:MAG: AMP-binding protein [Bacteroidales bacterium]|nr:AMP-binding protein [Bacteroidales bacterium]